jgi:hypothetical protein
MPRAETGYWPPLWPGVSRPNGEDREADSDERPHE